MAHLQDTPSSNQYVPGGTITYTITYWNSGAGTATNVSVTDRMPNYFGLCHRDNEDG